MNYFVEEASTRHYFIKPRGDRYRKGLKFIAEKVMKSYSIYGLPINKNDLVVDVGANNGDLILGLPMCRYTAFEPAPIEFALLVKNKFPDAQIHNLAVGKESKKSQFYLSSQGADSSLFEPPTVDKVIQVQQVRLDEVLNESIKLLKIDAEGGELEVLMGAQNILDQIDYIAVDVGFEKGKNQESTAPEVLNFLYSNDFELFQHTNDLRFLFRNKTFKKFRENKI